jgi:hypothetical protein
LFLFRADLGFGLQPGLGFENLLSPILASFQFFGQFVPAAAAQGRVLLPSTCSACSNQLILSRENLYQFTVCVQIK